MKINWLKLEDFRGFRDCEITFSNTSNIAVFIGINGAGKSAILDAISILLNIIAKQIRSQKVTKTLLFNYVKPVVLNSKDAYSWRCRVYPLPALSGPYLYEKGLDLTRVCQEQYGRGAYASPMNTKDAYSWQCYR